MTIRLKANWGKNEREKGREREREEGIGDDRGDVCSVTQSRQQ